MGPGQGAWRRELGADNIDNPAAASRQKGVFRQKYENLMKIKANPELPGEGGAGLKPNLTVYRRTTASDSSKSELGDEAANQNSPRAASLGPLGRSSCGGRGCRCGGTCTSGTGTGFQHRKDT